MLGTISKFAKLASRSTSRFAAAPDLPRTELDLTVKKKMKKK